MAESDERWWHGQVWDIEKDALKQIIDTAKATQVSTDSVWLGCFLVKIGLTYYTHARKSHLLPVEYEIIYAQIKQLAFSNLFSP